MSLAYRLKFFVYMCCYFAVCPVPMNKEEEEFIKERERNRELMEEIAREIEMTCLGKLCVAIFLIALTLILSK